MQQMLVSVESERKLVGMHRRSGGNRRYLPDGGLWWNGLHHNHTEPVPGLMHGIEAGRRNRTHRRFGRAADIA